MAWIEAHQTLRSHRKTGRLARALGISRPQVIGHLMCLWWWCLDNAPSGDIQCCDAEDLAEAADWEGDPSTFVFALVSAGYVDVNEVGEYTQVHDWMDYAGRLVQKRAANAERMRKARSEHMHVTSDARTDDVHDTCDAHPLHVHDTCDARAGATVPNRTVPNRKSTPLPPEGDVQAWFTDTFWPEYPRKENKALALKAMEKLNPSTELRETIIACLQRAKSFRDWLKDSGQYIPHPSTWINQRRWEDEVPVQPEQRKGQVINGVFLPDPTEAEIKEAQDALLLMQQKRREREAQFAAEEAARNGHSNLPDQQIIRLAP